MPLLALRAAAPLITLLIALLPGPSRAQDATGPAPRQLVERLGVLTRQAIEKPAAGLSFDAVERSAAEQILAWSQRGLGNTALAEADELGRTPLMLAVSGGHVQVVEALLAEPAVRAGIHSRNRAGETAWMIAATAPAITLAACEPGTLTLERYPLLVPYLLRASVLMEDGNAAPKRIAKLLEATGATPEPDAARLAWLARCPNTQSATRERITRGELLDTLLADTIERVRGFNKLQGRAPALLPDRPPADKRFVPRHPAAIALAEPKASRLRCTTQPAPLVHGALGWSGRATLTARAVTRAGIVETADIDSAAGTDPVVAAYFRKLAIRALADYRCEGDAVFEQTFDFHIE